MRILVIIIPLLFIPGLGFSQGEDQLLPSEQRHLTIVTEPATLSKGFFRVGITGFYTSVKREFDDLVKKR